MKTGRLTALAAVTAATLGLAACQVGSSPEDGPPMGNAIAQKSPEALDPAGQIIELDEENNQVSDMEAAGDILALRSSDKLTVGTLSEVDSGDATTIDISESCGDLTANANTFVLACGDEVLLIDAASPADVTSREVPEVASATAAALTSSGALLVGSDEEDIVHVYQEGEEPDAIQVAANTTQMITVPVDGSEDHAVRSYNPNTTIQDVHWETSEQGGTLRVGLGIGQMAAGEDGLIIVSDNMGDQIAIYTATDVVRLHQTAPVDPSPWGVAWDAQRDLAWIASTGANTITGYTVSTGAPVQQQQVNSIADAHNILVLPDGTLVAASATGDGLQVINDLKDSGSN